VNLLPDGFSGVQWTLLLPLLSRARFSLKYPEFLNDKKAVEIIELLSGPLSVGADDKSLGADLGNAARARVLDDAVRSFTTEHPKAAIVNLGAGLDTAFSRVDNGEVTWFDIDLPEVMEMRKLIIPETDRSRCIAGTILDSAWMREIVPASGGVLMIAGGVLPYFTEQQVKDLVVSLTDHFPSCDVVFDAVSERGELNSNQSIKNAGISSASMKWSVGKENDLNKWDRRVVVLKHCPLFADIERSANFDENIIRIMDECDKSWSMSIVHLRLGDSRSR
jgi:O-methyltransferase involved in polyketide biosynthesis